MSMMTIFPSIKTAILVGLYALHVTSLPSTPKPRDHLVCSLGTTCTMMATCENNFNVVPGSDPATPGQAPASNQPYTRDLHGRGLLSSSGASDRFTKRQSDAHKWCAIGTSEYIAITPQSSNVKINANNIRGLVSSAITIVQQHISALGDGPVVPPVKPSNTATSTASKATGSVAASSAAAANSVPISIPLVPISPGTTTNGGPAGDPTAAIFSIGPDTNGADYLSVWQGSDSDLSWGQLLIALNLLGNPTPGNGSYWDPKGTNPVGWINVGIVVGASQVGKMSIY